MKIRVDNLLVEKGFFDSREKAKRAIMAGIIIVNDERIEKAGTFIKLDNEPNIRIKGEKLKYVSRGGLKLEKAIKVFDLDLKGKRVLDVGASTGGFTDCALQNGADYLYSVDVGTNQLAWKLRDNPKVKSIENMHIKDLTLENLDNKLVDNVVMDVSFISITKIMPDLKDFINEDGTIMALIKPQFEVGRENIEKGGIVKNFSKHKMAINKIIDICKENSLYLMGLDVSPITGTKGNVEYISLFSKKDLSVKIDIDAIIEEAKKLKKS